MSGWRPLLWFWLSILSVIAVGGAVLAYLGPLPPERSARDRGSLGLQQAAGPTDPEPSMAATPAASPPTPTDEQLARPLSDARMADARMSGARLSDVRAIGGDQASTPPRSPALVIVYPAGSGDGRAAAEQLASRAGLAPDRIDKEIAADVPAQATIRFYSVDDHALARRLGKEVAQLGYAWHIENLSDRPAPPGHQAVEVLLPER